MITGYFITALCSFSYIFVENSWQLLGVQALLGLGVALCNPTWYALYDKYSSKESLGFTWGLADGQAKILIGIAILIGGYVVQFASFQALFIMMGTFQLLATFYQMKILKKD